MILTTALLYFVFGFIWMLRTDSTPREFVYMTAVYWALVFLSIRIICQT